MRRKHLNIKMDAVIVGTIRHYFELLETTLKDNNLLHSPGQIYNVDETGVPLDPKLPNVIVRTGSKKVRYKTTGKKSQVTVVISSTSTLLALPFSVKELSSAMTVPCTNSTATTHPISMTRSDLTASQESILSPTSYTDNTYSSNKQLRYCHENTSRSSKELG